MQSEISVPYARVAAFLRQHTHDVRNHLNGLDLEAALLADIVQDPEALESVTRLRGQIRETANGLRALSARIADPLPGGALLAARDLFLIWQDEAAALELWPVKWSETLGEERVNVDPSGMAAVFRELLTNARQFGKAGASLQATVGSAGGRVIFELSEEKDAPLEVGGWGKGPFSSTRRGGYGLGLWVVERLVRASEGEVTREFCDGKTLVTRLSFPAK